MSSLQLNILLLSLGVLQGAFLFFLLFKKRKSLPGYIFLAAYLGVMLLQVSMKIASKMWLMQNIDPLYQFSYQLPFLYGPLLYLFACRFTGYRKTNKKDWLHFIPVIFLIGIYVMWEVGLPVPGIFTIFFRVTWAVFFQLGSIIAYHVAALFILKKYFRQTATTMATPVRVRLKWIRQFTWASMIVCSIIAIVICLMYLGNPHWRNVRFGFISLTFFIYWISYQAWSQPELFSIIRGYSTTGNALLPAPLLTVHLPGKKYSNSGLAAEELDRIISALEQTMKGEKLFLDPNLTIDDLARSVNCSRHHLSQAMNERLNQSFYDHINQYRVEEARLLLTSPEKARHKIASIAFDAGFNSISTFNEVFKKITGQTPSQFRKQREDKDLKKQRV